MRAIGQSRLRYFEAVFRHGSVRGAAEALDTAPSVVTRQLTLLEEELGIPLFERRSRGMRPTEFAGHVMNYCRGCQAHRQQLEERIDAFERADEGSVRIVLSEGYIDHLVRYVVGPFCSKHPKVVVAVDPLPVLDIVDQVAEDGAHIGIAYNPLSDSRVAFLATVPAPTKLLVRSDHPLASVGGAVSVAQISAFPLASMPSGFGVSRLIEALEYSEHLKLRATFTSSSVVALKRHVRTTQSVAFVGAGVAAAPEVASGDLRMLDIAHDLCASAKLRLLTRRGRPLSPAASRLTADIKRRLASFGE